jgi:adenosylcobyric acid synthase
MFTRIGHRIHRWPPAWSSRAHGSAIANGDANTRCTETYFVHANARVIAEKMAMQARTLMVQGTASSVGKSLIVTALCRLFRQTGLRVAPFKSQNMALNSFVTPDGAEIGRAQAVQAEAAGIAPSVEMNPILLKPEGDTRSQVVLMGRPTGSFTFSEYHLRKPELIHIIAECLARLRAAYDIVVIEGAGSPAEINLASHDIVNMHVAETAGAPVILVGDIDRGGVFAQFVGTIDLLEAAHRARVAAFLINKFRGDARLLKPGLDYLEQRFAIPVIGVVPYIPRLRIADEDSVALEDRRGRTAASLTEIGIAIIRLPHISNYDDFLALEHEPGVVVRFNESPLEIKDADLVVIPGSKSTVADLEWMRTSGFAEAIISRARRREPIVGICGGCQMLGETIADPDGIESPTRNTAGLNLLRISTSFGREKRTAQVRARVAMPSLLSGEAAIEGELNGYEIHMGRIERRAGAAAPFRIVARNGVTENMATDDALDGAINTDGTIVGTMIHGILENDEVRSALLRTLRQRKGIATPDGPPIPTREAEYDRLAAMVRANIDWEMIELIAGLR